MTKTSGIGAGTGLAIGTVATVVVVGGGFFLARNGTLGEGARTMVERQLGVLGLAVPPAPAVVPADPAPDPAPEPNAAASSPAEPEAEAEPGFELSPPRLEVARFETDGSGIVAGSAQVGVEVQVLLDGTVLDTQTVPEAGEFVSFVTIELSDQPRMLTLVARFDGQEATSEDSFILAPVTPQLAEADPAPQQAETDPAEDPVALAQADALVDGAEPDADASAGDQAVAIADPVASDALGEAEEGGATSAPPTEEGPETTDAIEATPDVDIAQATPEAASSAASAEENTPADATPDATPDSMPDAAAETAASDAATAPADAARPAQLGVDADTTVATASPETGPAQTDLAVDGQPDPTPAQVAEATPVEPAAPTVAESATPAVEVAETDRQPPQAAAQTPDVTASEEAVEADATPAPRPEVAVTVLRAGRDGVSLVQPATPVAPELLDKIALDTIGYTDAGEVQLAGRARPEALVRVYLDNSPVADIPARGDGRWSGSLASVAPGIYTLRLDEIDPVEGKVLSRLETPFKREAPEVLQPGITADADPDAPRPVIRAVTVQKGDSLWAISQQRYGSGYLYLRVFEANKSDIRDPDLIYPGQIFTLPE